VRINNSVYSYPEKARFSTQTNATAKKSQNLVPFWRKSFEGRVRIDQSVQRPAMGLTVRVSNPGGGEIFRKGQDRAWDPLSHL